MKTKYFSFTILIAILISSITLTYCETASSKESSNILVDSSHQQLIMDNAILAEEANVCKLDWESFYLLFMQVERKKAKELNWSDKKISLIGALFGMYQGKFSDSLNAIPITNKRINNISSQIKIKTAEFNTFLNSNLKPGFNNFVHPTNVFSVEYPKEWGSPEMFEHNNNVFMFNVNGKSPSLTISITQNINLPEELSSNIFAYMFPDETPVGDLIREKTKTWNSMYQLFEANSGDKKTQWYVTYFGYKTNAIAITLSAPKDEIENYSITYKNIIESITFF